MGLWITNCLNYFLCPALLCELKIEADNISTLENRRKGFGVWVWGWGLGPCLRQGFARRPGAPRSLKDPGKPQGSLVLRAVSWLAEQADQARYSRPKAQLLGGKEAAPFVLASLDLVDPFVLLSSIEDQESTSGRARPNSGLLQPRTSPSATRPFFTSALIKGKVRPKNKVI